MTTTGHTFIFNIIIADPAQLALFFIALLLFDYACTCFWLYWFIFACT